MNLITNKIYKFKNKVKIKKNGFKTINWWS